MMNHSETSSDKFQPMDPEDFRKQVHRTVDFIADYYKNIESYPVLSPVEPGFLLSQLPNIAPINAEPLEAVLRDVEKYIIPGLLHWVSPNFFAYFPLTTSTAGFIGEMLCSAFNALGFNWIASPAGTELEMVVMDWMANIFGLPPSFSFSGTGGGVIHSSTSEAILCTVVAARDRVLARLEPGSLSKLVAYGSDQTHSVFGKACRIAGIAPCNIRLLETSPNVKSAECSLSPVLLRRTMEDDVAAGLIPFYVCATVGTTSTTAVDPVREVAEVASNYTAWVHIDAAYAGSACICPEFRHHLDGVELVDSISISPYKWLLSHLDCCCVWVRHPDFLMKSLSLDGEYIQNSFSDSKNVVDYKDWQIGLTRRFRALRLWVILRCYGVANLQAHIRSDVELAKMFEQLVVQDPRFEVVVPRKFGLVCFRLGTRGCNSDRVDELNESLLKAVNSTGRVYMTHTKVGGAYILRFVVGVVSTEERHVAAAWDLIKEKADDLVGKLG
uniref:Tyrosine decarboxylase n=1 Tax=Asarum sp. XW-2018 TaxID=2497021 RepID=A0A3Q8VR57_9MAGN|nr:tyrosine decarboxylase [Asarum sp. XW-2018]